MRDMPVNIPLTVRLEPVTVENWRDCVGLSVREEQSQFVPSNLYSIAEAQFYPDAEALAIYAPSNRIVGFALYGRDVFTGRWKVFRLMIDARHQHQGYGRAAFAEILARIERAPDADHVVVCYHSENDIARRLYRRFGFSEQSTDDTGRVTAVRSKVTS